MIRIDRTAHANVFKTLTRRATCEKCGCRYMFAVSASGWGRATGTLLDGDRTREEALGYAHLQANLRILSEPVACPDCGWYQKAMVKELRRRHQRWMLVPGLGLLLIVGLALVIRIFGGMDTRRGVLAYDAMPSPMFLGIAAALSAVVASVGRFAT